MGVGKFLKRGVAALAVALGLALPAWEHASAQEPKAMSEAFERFRYSFFEDKYSARDGLDTMSLARLEGEERATAEDLLIRYLPDARGIIGLGVLRSHRAEPHLVALFENERRMEARSKRPGREKWSPRRLMYVADALLRIRFDPRWSAAVIEVLPSAKQWTDRLAAAEALVHAPDPDAVRALTRALDDPHNLVRHHAARALILLHGLPAEPDGKEHMMYRVMSDEAARREGGKRDILAAVAGRAIVTK